MPRLASRHNPLARVLERLEDRCLLSASHGLISSIQFSQAPAAVQTALNTLAEGDGLADPAATQTVYLGNSKGKETYTVDLSSIGTSTVLTVDQKGNTFTAPVKSTAMFGDVTNTGVTDEFNAIAAALGLTSPAATDNVNVLTNGDGTAVYTMTLMNAGGTGRHSRGQTFSVDSSGNPTGNESVPLGVLSSAIQNGLTSNAPAGATALTDASLISVQTHDGVTTYSATYHSTGIRTTVSVDNTGALANLPSTSTVKFADVPGAAQAELQSLATANGYAGTIADTQNVTAYDEANGTTIYAVRLPVTGTGKSGTTYTYLIAVASDQSGNPTVPPEDGRGGRGGCDGDDGGFGRHGFGGFGGDGGDDGGGSGSSTTPSGFSGFSRHAGFRFRI